MPLVPPIKITVPRMPPWFVARPRLTRDLDAAATADLSLVRAPAGYGKTLLLADWSRSTVAVDTAWVGIDRDDNDPRRLWASVAAALATCPSIPPGDRVHAPRSWRPADVPEFVAELADALAALPRPIRLVLDDVHELVDPDVVHGIRILARIKPPTVHLVLAGRHELPLSLPRLRLGGRLLELRSADLTFTRDEAAALLTTSGLDLTPAQVDLLHLRTGGWAAGLRLAVLGLERADDRDAFLTRFSGDERSVADYLGGEILSGLPEDVREFLRVISISNPVPAALAAELSGRHDAGCVLDELERRTSLVSVAGHQDDAYCVQELLHTHLLADLSRHDDRRVTALHATAARWWAGRDEPGPTLEHAARSREPALLTDLLHRFAVPLLLRGDHRSLRHALAGAEACGAGDDPWSSLTSALGHVQAGELSAARDALGSARACRPADDRPADDSAELAVLRGVAEQFYAGTPGVAPVADDDRSPGTPELEVLARLSRGADRLARRDRDGARAEFDVVLTLSHRHGFEYAHALALVLLGVVAVSAGDLRTTRAVCREALDAVDEHGWGGTPLPAAAAAMLAYAELTGCEAAAAERVAAGGLAAEADAIPPRIRFALQAVHGAAAFDLGDRAGGLAELQRARTDLGTEEPGVELCAAMALLEFRVALLLGHAAAAHGALAWLAERTGECGEILMMRAWTESARHHRQHARTLIRPVLDGSIPVLLPTTVVEAWVLETSVALAAGERFAARHALQTAMAEAAPLDAVRPFALAEQGVRELLVHQHGSFGGRYEFAERALGAGRERAPQTALLSEREITVLGLLPSLLSLDAIAADLTVSVNTVKSHVRSIYTKLGVSSRRLAVVAAHERGLIAGGHGADRAGGAVPSSVRPAGRSSSALTTADTTSRSPSTTSQDSSVTATPISPYRAVSRPTAAGR